MKDPSTVIFFLLIILGVLFEQFAKFRKQQKRKSQHKNSESAEQFFRRIKSEQQKETAVEPEIRYEPNTQNKSTSLAETLTHSAEAEQTSCKKKRKKMVVDIHNKSKLKEAYIMKTILDRPQAYKF